LQAQLNSPIQQQQQQSNRPVEVEKDNPDVMKATLLSPRWKLSAGLEIGVAIICT
jgi:hypothetical protein